MLHESSLPKKRVNTKLNMVICVLCIVLGILVTGLSIQPQKLMAPLDYRTASSEVV